MYPSTAPDVTSAPAPRRRAPIVIAVVAVVAVLLAAGAAVAYVLYRGNAKFDAIPPACDTIRPHAARLGAYELRDTRYHRVCELWLAKDHPAYVDAWKISVGFYAEVEGEGPAAPQSVPDMMREIAAQADPVPGLGDEAYRRNRNLYIRVSNLIVIVMVMPNPVSSEAQVNDFTTALVADLDS